MPISHEEALFVYQAMTRTNNTGNRVLDAGSGYSLDMDTEVGDFSTLSAAGSSITNRASFVDFLLQTGKGANAHETLVGEVRAVAKVYYTVFGRDPDLDGFEFWVDVMRQLRDSDNDFRDDIEDMISSFWTQEQEYIDNFPASDSNTLFLNKIFANQGRTPDAAGVSWWTNLLDNGLVTRPEVLSHFALSSEFESHSGVSKIDAFVKDLTNKALPDFLSGGSHTSYNVEIDFADRERNNHASWEPRYQIEVIEAAQHLSSIILGDTPEIFIRPPSMELTDRDSDHVYIVNPGVIDDIRVIADVWYIPSINSLAEAAPRIWNNVDDTNGDVIGRTTNVAVMDINARHISRLQSDEQLDEVILHELFHSVGFSGKFWSKIQEGGVNNLLFNGIVDGVDGSWFVGEFAEQLHGSPILIADDQGYHGAFSSGSHWDENVFGGELMTPAVNSSVFLSDFTVAALEDIGYDTYLDRPGVVDQTGPAPGNDIFSSAANSGSAQLVSLGREENTATQMPEISGENMQAGVELSEAEIEYLRPLLQGALEYYELPQSFYEAAMNSSQPEYIFKMYKVEVGDVDALREVAPQVFEKSEPRLMPQWKIDKINEWKNNLKIDIDPLISTPKENIYYEKSEESESINFQQTMMYDTTNSFGERGFEIRGGPFDDYLPGSDYDELMLGYEGDDELEVTGGDDILVGGEGMDIAVFDMDQSRYTLRFAANGDIVEVIDHNHDRDGTNLLFGMEFLDFDTNLFDTPMELAKFDGMTSISENEALSLVELYIAYFNRAPDAIGLNFWATAYANGMSIEEIAAGFLDQEETRALYPDGQTNLQFVMDVYSNVLGRTADQAGRDFWVGQLDSGNVSKDVFILEILKGTKAQAMPGASEEFLSQQTADREHLATKTDIGADFSIIRGMSNQDNAKLVMDMYASGADHASIFEEVADMYLAATDPSTGEFIIKVDRVINDPFEV